MVGRMQREHLSYALGYTASEALRSGQIFLAELLLSLANDETFTQHIMDLLDEADDNPDIRKLIQDRLLNG